jgi:hypothetical protein
MRTRVLSSLAAGIALLFLGCVLVAGSEVKSRPSVGSAVPGSFHAREVFSGQNIPFVEEFEFKSPVVLVFARQIDDLLVKLITGIDKAVAKNNDDPKKTKDVYSLTVLLTDDDERDAKTLRAIAEKQKFKYMYLATTNPAGPRNYRLNRDAGVIVIFYEKNTVKANYAFKKGGLDEKSIDKVISGLSKHFAE